MLLAGDIGGTKTHLAIFMSKDTLRSPVWEKTFPSANYASLEALVGDFLSQSPVPYSLASACFGVAGPVIAGKAKVTNLPWNMDEQALALAFHVPVVYLLNDLYAMAHAIPDLQPDDLYTINVGVPEEHGTLAVVAPGTGLGEGFLTWANDRYVAHSSEGGHSDFAPTNDLELDLLRYLLHKGFQHVSYEHVCSGIGLPNIYQFFLDTAGIVELPQVTQALAVAKDPTPVIVNAARDKENPSSLCVQTLQMFMHILGAECGNMVLKVLSTAGVYIGGGIPPRLLSLFDDEAFMSAFDNKGRFKAMLRDVPVHIILNKYPALLGAAYYGFGA
jgi:glucokinase